MLYYFKMIVMYCIEFLICLMVVLFGFYFGGVCEVFGYFLKFLKLVFDKEILLEFFLGNEYLGKIFLDFYFVKEYRKYNLFVKENFR